MLQSERILFVILVCHEKVIPGYTLIFCRTKPVDKKVKNYSFHRIGPSPIQSSSRNVNYKDEALKPLLGKMPQNNNKYRFGTLTVTSNIPDLKEVLKIG